MQAAIEQSKSAREALRQQVITATEEFRSKSRFYVTQDGAGWVVVSAADDRVYGRNTSYSQAIRYAESLERAIESKATPIMAVIKVKHIGERATRWAALFALAMIVAGAATS
ncbi:MULTISPECIES: hypothetical protein [unclassified Pseudomonas]|uniref:hypothetical protein n=1 Tax=unclassified Pseudomonas TaxID=196821 RepID=UPI0021BB1287|nr:MULTISPECIES: hypothetical protein [unclassified Pseudomonas]MCT8164980.1 hypothetical protein [Pseudomonas sp. HD6422]MCT8183878.1 hypothetical protein [Pseudomonas sp. HD6421]